MNAKLKLSDVKLFIVENLANQNARKAELIAERPALQEKRSPISSAPPTTEEMIEALLDRTHEVGQLYLDDVAAFAFKLPSGIQRFSHSSAIASEIGTGGILQFEASSHGLAYLMTLPENRAQLKAALLTRLPPTPGALSRAERAALLAPIDARLAEIDAELQAIDDELAQLSFAPAA